MACRRSVAGDIEAAAECAQVSRRSLRPVLADRVSEAVPQLHRRAVDSAVVAVAPVSVAMCRFIALVVLVSVPTGLRLDVIAVVLVVIVVELPFSTEAAASWIAARSFQRAP